MVKQIKLSKGITNVGSKVMSKFFLRGWVPPNFTTFPQNYNLKYFIFNTWRATFSAPSSKNIHEFSPLNERVNENILIFNTFLSINFSILLTALINTIAFFSKLTLLVIQIVAHYKIMFFMHLNLLFFLIISKM